MFFGVGSGVYDGKPKFKNELEETLWNIKQKKKALHTKIEEYTEEALDGGLDKKKLDNFINKIELLPEEEQSRAIKRLSDRNESKNLDPTMLLIKRKSGVEARAESIYYYYGNLFESNKKNDSILSELEKTSFYTKDVENTYFKIVAEKEKK